MSTVSAATIVSSVGLVPETYTLRYRLPTAETVPDSATVPNTADTTANMCERCNADRPLRAGAGEQRCFWQLCGTPLCRDRK